MLKRTIGISCCILLFLCTVPVSSGATCSDTTLYCHVMGSLPLPRMINTITAMTLNIGDTSAKNVTYTLSISGGFIGNINFSDVGECDELQPGVAVGFSVYGVSGFGPMSITMTVTAANAENVTITVKGLQCRGFTWVPMSWVQLFFV